MNATGTATGTAPDSQPTPGHVLGPLVMGVVNVTPDSFSAGGRELEPGAAVAHGLALRDAGADLVDVGGEATNPQAHPVTAEVELARVLPVVEQLARAGVTVSIDTTKAIVAREAVAVGASVINDVSGGLFDRAMAAEVTALGARTQVTYIAGHLRGTTLAQVFASEAPATWQDVAVELRARLEAFGPAVRERAWIDPGVGFGKGADPDGNLGLLAHAGDLARAVGRPVVVGPSRKRFLRRLLVADAGARGGQPTPGWPDDLALEMASVAACLGAIRAGASVVRVHNVALLRAALAVYTRL